LNQPLHNTRTCSSSDDNEFARYLAQHLTDNDYWVTAGPISGVYPEIFIDQGVLYSIIDDFMKQLP
jgi:hypothetical protein